MRKKHVLCVLIGVILVAIGAILITEGGFRFSCITYDQLPQYAIQDTVNSFPCLLEYSDQKDVAISVYMDENSKDSFYVLEFARNMIFNRYSLVDTHICVVSDQPFYSVVSTAFSDYAYCVDLSNSSIVFFEEKNSSTLFYSLFILFLGSAIIIYTKKGQFI